MDAAANLRSLIAEPTLLRVPVVFDAMSALLARRAGYSAAYVGGATLGYLRGATEAALTPHDFAIVGADIRSVSDIPLVMDGGVGWGDPMHLKRVLRLAEAAGYNAIEIEDQVAPKRAHHHIGVEHLVPVEDMVAKIEEAVRLRRDPDLLILARTNAVREGLDEALRRCEALAKAGADMIFPVTGVPEQMRALGERVTAPLVQMVFPGASFSAMGVPEDELIGMNYRMLIDGITPFAHMYEALSSSYGALAGAPQAADIIYSAMASANELVGLAELIDIERRTTERGSISRD